MGFSCEIHFPYNSSEEFYCGEKLQLSIQLQCHKESRIKGVVLLVSCSSRWTNDSNLQFSSYIDDQDVTYQQNLRNNRTTDHHTEIDLISVKDEAVILKPGTYVFDVECFLPDMIAELCDDNTKTDFNLSVKVKKELQEDCEKRKSQSNYYHTEFGSRRHVLFVWPGYFDRISSYSLANAAVHSYYVASAEHQNNRSQYEEDSLENWLDQFIEKPKLTDDG